MKINILVIQILTLLLAAPFSAAAQSSVSAPATIDSTKNSHVSLFRTTGITDTSKVIVRVLVKEIGSETVIQGATVLFKRDQDKMLGRVTKPDGRCVFNPTPATYSIRVQLTGYQSLDQPDFAFESGKVYEMAVRMAHQ
ncbi:MAG: carboxypeptidase regulatory-like domain-containing protein [Saprospiraceae bacterium]|nr:carboxypeptidase regulatory-like domain-containing protein [Saprospiraceae bacterium]